MLRFIMPAKGSPPGGADILLFDIGPAGRSRMLQKYLVANAFLRYAATLDVHFIGRSEDDAFVNIDALAVHLRHLIPLISGPLLYGVRGEWVMWSPTTMTPFCWAHSLRRWQLQRKRDAASSSDPLHPPSDECLETYMGPAMLVKGPLVVYSRDLARTLVALPTFSHDEARATSDTDALKAKRLVAERHARPNAPRLGVVYAPIAEDVYYSVLIGAAMGNRSLTFVSVPMAEYSWATPESKRLKELPAAAVYHRLSSARQLNASGLLDAKHHRLGSWWHKRESASQVHERLARCEGFAKLVKHGSIGASMPCCHAWRHCPA